MGIKYVYNFDTDKLDAIDVTDVNPLNVGAVQFDVAHTPLPSAPGLIQWNTVDGTYDMGLLNSSVLQVGQEMMFYGKASGAIANGDVCQFAGVQGDHILIKKAVGSEIEANPHYLVGVATENIANNNYGYVTWFGKINGIYTKTPANQDNADWVEGDILYFNVTTGQMTKTKPTAPNRIITIAAVIKLQTGSSESGIIIVRPLIGTKLQDLDDVDGTPLSANGQIPVWDNDNQYFDFTANINSYLLTGGWYDTAQSLINLTGFNNDLGNYGGWLTYWDTISYAESAGYASSADSANYAQYCDYATYWGNQSFPGGAGYLYWDGGTLSWQSIDLSGYVPYTGASSPVDLGAQSLTTTAYITGELAKVTTDEPTAQTGNLWLDTDEPELYRFGGQNDYTEFNTSTGHQTMIGSARPWRDELGDVTKLRINGPGVEDNFAQATVTFTNLSNMSDFIYTNLQLNHDKDLSSELHPHLHWFQLGSATNSGSVTPNFYLEHRWQVNGGSMTPSWTGAIPTMNAFPTTGSLNQITVFPAITPPSGTSISDIVQFKIFRDNGNSTGSFAGNDNIAGGVDLTSFDVHFMTNSLGSDEEYVK